MSKPTQIENEQTKLNSHLLTLATQDSVHQDNAQTTELASEHSSRAADIRG